MTGPASPPAAETKKKEAHAAAAPAKRDNRRIRVYDFRRPDKFSKDQFRTVSMIHDNFVRSLSTFFSANFRTSYQMAVTSVDQVTYGEFVKTLSEPTVMGVFSLPPLEGSAIIDIPPNLVFPMIDRLFGGLGASLDKPRALTEIEQSVMEKIMRGFLTSLAEAWTNVIQLDPVLEAIESNPLLSQVSGPGEICMSVLIETHIGEHRGMISLCYPYFLIEPVISKLTAHNWFASTQRQPTPTMLEALNARLAQARVPVSALLGHAQVTIGELVNLEVGDVIALDRRYGAPVDVLVGQRPKFLAQPGSMNGRLALRIEAILQPEEEDGV